LLTLGIPLVLWLWAPPSAILPTVWGMALLCAWVILKVDPKQLTGSWGWKAISPEHLWPMLARFVICAVLMAGLTWVYRPEMLFGFVREHPAMWAMVLLLYPLLSVLPQEIIYRRYMFARYATLLPNQVWLVLISGIAFGFGHIVFGNWIAPALCVVGGVLFSMTYQKTRSLALVCLEHALYGNFVFTIGLGRYFYHGAVGASP
jgi:hypothetical protein